MGGWRTLCLKTMVAGEINVSDRKESVKRRKGCQMGRGEVDGVGVEIEKCQ